MKNNQGYKNQALAALSGRWAQAVVCTVVMFLIICALVGPSYIADMSALGMMPMSLSLVEVLTLVGIPVSIFLVYPLMLGYAIAFNKLVVEGDDALTGNMFKIMFSGYIRNVWGLFLMSIFIILWSMLLIIPGLIKAFSYAMTPYILKDYPELSANQAINLSRKMMKGHKFDLFWLNFSFIGWIILCALTLGVAYVWLMPYMQTANAAFYQDLKKEYVENNPNN